MSATTPQEQNTNTEIRDYIILAAIGLLRYAASVRRRIAAALDELNTALVGEIGYTALTDFKRRQLNGFLQKTEDLIAKEYGAIATDMNVELIGLMNLQIKVELGAINDSIGLELAEATFTAEQISVLASNFLIEGAPSAEWWARAGTTTSNSFADIVRNSILRGETNAEIVARVRDIGGLMPTAVTQATALVRTSVQSAANEIRLRIFQANKDLFDGIQWVSTLDSRTTPICQALDGLIWDNDLNPVGHSHAFPGVIAHWGCRSTQVPVLKKWADLLDDKNIADKLDAYEAENPGTRASVDGQVADSITYERWLESRPVSVQKEILGLGKWKLWNSDKLSFTDLINNDNRPLTLAQLMAKYGN
jgi:SPP1 gp7 family putative phage head morphogenesis protein